MKNSTYYSDSSESPKRDYFPSGVCAITQRPLTVENGFAPHPQLTLHTPEAFSYYGKGVIAMKTGRWAPSSKPIGVVDIAWTGQFIRSGQTRWATEELHTTFANATREAKQDFKAREFPTVTGGGIFTYRNAKGLVHRSKYIVIDIDDLSSIEEARQVKQTLISDPYVETALAFVSPKGLGVKWWAEVPAWCQGMEFREQYTALSQHIAFHYGLVADPACSDVSRACYLPYDPECFINPKYLTKKLYQND